MRNACTAVEIDEIWKFSDISGPTTIPPATSVLPATCVTEEAFGFADAFWMAMLLSEALTEMARSIYDAKRKKSQA